jgi:4a-hydroxytetrahydrobiopterin dehydratase
MADVLSKEQVNKALGGLPGWAFVDGKLHKELRFRDFNEAFGFMARVALVAEKRDHHPDWSNSWNSVVIDIVNHAAGGVTTSCLDLAIDVEAISREMVDSPISDA